MSVEIQFTHRNGTAHSEALIALTKEKFHRVYKLAPKITKIHVTFATEHLSQIAKAEVHVPKLNPIFAEAESEDIYKSVDLLVDRLIKKLSKDKL